MKDNRTEDQVITTSEQFASVNMGISDDPEDQKMILNILTNTLYTDKIAAVLREYGCNAADSNTEAGKPDVPIQVHVPTTEEPWFSVRDEGGGMSSEQVTKVFCRLGRSTKRQSNAYTGMLGIGSKAGFAYGDSFVVRSFSGGTCTTYNCFRDGKGLPQMSQMNVAPSKEPAGIEIRLAVKLDDVLEFQSSAKEIYGRFKIAPLGVERLPSESVCVGTNWRIREGDHRAESVVIMGNV